MNNAESRLGKAGLELPGAVGTQYAYQPILRHGNMAYLAGQLAKLPGDHVMHPGIVGNGIGLEQAQSAARACALQSLAWLKAELGSLDTVRQIVRLNGYVRVGPDGFDRMSEVIDAASQVYAQAFGQQGHHVRSVLGVADLPRHASVMIDLTVAIDVD